MNNKSEKILYVAIGCDVDPDRNYLIKDISTDTLSWRGMLEGIPRCREELQDLVDIDGKPPVVVWLLRVDYQIKVIHGAYNYILAKHTDFLKELEKAGDELGWHPHFWSYDKNKSVWYQNFADIDWQIEMLNKVHAAFEEILPGRTKTVRTGWTYHNNQTMNRLGELGVEVDISAFPGLKIPPDKKQKVLSNFYDWYDTPAQPYYPSMVDYRRPAIKGEESCTVLEVPNLTAKSIFWGMVSGLVLAKKTRSLRQIGYSLSKPRFLPTITGSPRMFKSMLSEIKRNMSKDGKLIFVTGLHADELIDNVHPVYSLKNMKMNISALLELADSINAKLKFIKGHEIKKYLSG